MDKMSNNTELNKKNYRILVVDDEPEYQTVFSYILRKQGYTVMTASSGQMALEMLMTNEIDMIMTDLKMPEMDGVELVKQVKSRYDGIDILVVTAFGSIESAVEAMKYGASGYSIKNSDPETLIADIDRIAKVTLLERENKILQEQNMMHGEAFLQSENPKMKQILETCKQLEDSDISVLILGESGVGKEVIARYIHSLSSRNSKHFIPVNCNVFAETMLESELFGHEKGAFTGAAEKRIGRFEAADQGTLFLDEIGDIPLNLQGKLLRAIENKEIERVGSNKPIKLDIRLICATNKDLEKEVKSKFFREDLMYRINTLTICVPPLRERKEDLPQLIDFFLRRIEKEQKKKILEIDPYTYDFLMNYDYPGNVRELKNILERMVALSKNGVLRSSGFTMASTKIENADNADSSEAVWPLRAARGLFEKEHIERALELTDGNVGEAANMLKITKRQLWNKISEYNIQR